MWWCKRRRIMYNLLIGGAAGQGIDTTVAILEKLIKRFGYSVFTYRDFMSRVRGGHNFMTIRFGTGEVLSHSHDLDGIIALDEATISIHRDELKEDGFILCDSNINTEDKRAIKLPMNNMAEELGNSKVSGVIAIGIILKLFGEKVDSVEEVLSDLLDEKYIEINVQAINEGYKNVDNRYTKLKGNFEDWMIISGSQALALGAIASGLRFYSAYPMSPSTPIMEYLALKGSEMGIVVEQAEDEIAAINMAIGASYAGARSMTGTSGGGFSLMVEAFGLAGITETPLVVVNVQRPGPATGLPTRTEQGDLKFMISASQGEFPRMIIAPRTHKDIFYQTIRAFDLAEKYQIPVVLLLDQYLGDSSGTVDPFDIRDLKISEPLREYSGEYLRYQYTDSGISPRLIPGKSHGLVLVDSDEHDESGKMIESAEVRIKMVDKRMKKIEMLKEELLEPDFIGNESFDTLLIGWGSMYGPLTEALSLLNSGESKEYAALVFGDVFPLPEKSFREKAEKAKEIINVEQNATGQLAGLVREYTGIACSRSVLKYDGRQITGKEIADEILRGGSNG
jgi:2-oxoglutarate ferredoxin oxidoreductase subunit alpha